MPENIANLDQLPLWVRFGVLYLYGCAFLTTCFGAEFALAWWEKRRGR